MRDFEYQEPENLAEAVDLLARYEGEARLLAGGMDLLLALKRRQLAPRCLINLKTIPGLEYIAGDGVLCIGALTTLSALEDSPLVRERFPVLAETAALMGPIQVRNLGTVGGNLCNADPSADLPPSLVALGARVKAVGAAGERCIPLEGFFLGAEKTALVADEVLTEIEVPPMPTGAAAVYLRYATRKVMGTALAGVAVFLQLERNSGTCQEVRIVLGALKGIPFRAAPAEALLRGQVLQDSGITEAAQAAAVGIEPLPDIRVSTAYRLEMVRLLTQAALMRARTLVLASPDHEA